MIIFAVAALLAVVAVGCGGDDGSSTSESTATQAGASGADGPGRDQTGQQGQGSATPQAGGAIPALTRTSQADATAPRSPSGATPAPGAESATATPTVDTAPSQAQNPETQPEKAEATPEQLREAGNGYRVGELFLLSRRYHRALHYFEQVIATNPDFAEAYTLRGFARVMVHDYEGGLQDLDRAIELEAANADRAYAFRSYAHSRLGNYDQAVQDAEKVTDPAVGNQSHFGGLEATAALFVAHFGSGEYSEVHLDHLNELPRAIREEPERARRFGGNPYGHYGLINDLSNGGNFFDSNVQQAMELDTELILNPDNPRLYYERGRALSQFGRHAKAVEDFTTAIELFGSDVWDGLYIERAQQYLELGEDEKIIQDRDLLDVAGNLEWGTLVALAYLRLDQSEDARRTIDALDYGYDVPLPRGASADSWFDGRVRNQVRGSLRSHLILKGALYAASGDYVEGVKYLNIAAGCGSRGQAGLTDYVDQNYGAHHVYGRSLTTGEIWGAMLETSLTGVEIWREILEKEGLVQPRIPPNEEERLKKEQRLEQQEQRAKALWEWCGFPAEFIADPIAGIWVASISPDGGGHGRAAHIDPVVASSDNASLLQFMAEFYWADPGPFYAGHAGHRVEHPINALWLIDRSIAQDPNVAEAYLLKARLHLVAKSVAADLEKDGILHSQDERTQWEQDHHDRAVEAWTKYESLAAPNTVTAADHFRRGHVLAGLGRKQDAQAAYQQAHALGYDESAIREALTQLTR